MMRENNGLAADAGSAQEGGVNISLRQWYAAHIVGHIAADPTVGKFIQNKNMDADQVGAHIARITLAIADALIKEETK